MKDETETNYHLRNIAAALKKPKEKTSLTELLAAVILGVFAGLATVLIAWIIVLIKAGVFAPFL